MSAVRTSIALAAATAALLAGATAPAAAEGETAPPPAPKTVWTLHKSWSFTTGLPAGRRMTVIQHCPSGSRLVKSPTRTLAAQTRKEEPNMGARVVFRELRATSVVTRYRITRVGTKAAAVAGAIVCKRTVAGDSTSLTGSSRTELRVFGPASKGVEAFNSTLMAASDTPAFNAGDYATTMSGAGVTRSRRSVDAFPSTHQKVVSEDDGDQFVDAYGVSSRSLRRGQYASIRNNYRYAVDVTRTQ